MPAFPRVAAPSAQSRISQRFVAVVVPVFLILIVAPTPLYARQTVLQPDGPNDPTMGGGGITVSPNTNSAALFSLKNNSGTAKTYALNAICSGAGVSSCNPWQSSATVAAGAQVFLGVNFHSEAGGTTGRVTFKASVAGVLADSAWAEVTVSGGGGGQVAPVVGVAAVNPGAVLARGQCVTIAIGSSAASECEDLRIVHPIPAVRAMNKTRTPTLVYSSAHAMPYPIVAANVTLPTGSQVPATVSAALKILNVTRDSGSWSGGQWNPGATKRIVLGFNSQTAGLASGIYDYQLNVTNVYAGGSHTTSATGKLVIVDRSTSPFGAGWWLAGLEKLDLGTMTWTGGDGSARVYTQRPGSVAPNRVWGAPSVTYADSIRERNGTYIRQLPDSVWVTFDGTGKHVQTRNRQGHVTIFGYNGSGRLQTVTLPPVAAPLTYTFNYDANGHLQTVVAPGETAPRTTTFTEGASTGWLTLIQEPDSRTVQFGVSTGGRIFSRTNRRGIATNFQYDAASKVSQSSIAGTTIVRNLSNVAILGIGAAAADPAQVKTVLTGPRPGITTAFFLNGAGAPDSIVNGAGKKTTLVRSATYPGLVTQTKSPGGNTVTATYDTHGRLATSGSLAPNGAIATTTYTWNLAWDEITQITNPDNSILSFFVDPATGNRMWQQDGRGPSSRTTFTYNSANQLWTVTPPGTPATTLVYDARGNLLTSTNAIGQVTTYTNNAIGLPTQIASPIETQTLAYSLRNEVNWQQTTSGQFVKVTNGYDEEGNLASVLRTGTSAPSLTTLWLYDNANRPYRQTEPDASFEVRGFDEAGNVTSVTTRRGKTITMVYDNLDRMTSRTYNGVTYSFSGNEITNAAYTDPYSYSDTGDTELFGYTDDGVINTATNKNASVTRSIHVSGAILSETLGIKSTNRTTSHNYTTAYGYDVMGRRTLLTPPAGFAGSPLSYTYDPLWGALTNATDVASNSFGFTYKAVGDLASITYPASFSRRMVYDSLGRLTRDTVSGPSGNPPFPKYPVQTIRSFTVTSRNARGQITASTDPGSFNADIVNATYSGLGFLLSSQLRQTLHSSIDGQGFFDANDSYPNYDGYGNLMSGTEQWGYNNQSVSRGISNGYVLGRLMSHSAGGDGTTSYSYDPGGNEEFQFRMISSSRVEERASYNRADDKLLAIDRRFLGMRTVEEYRYDALGRRVWVRRSVQCQGANQPFDCVTSNVRRTIWDGVRELAEIQAPLNSSNPALEEMDSLWSTQPNNGSAGDPNPFLGRVIYGPSVDIDQPLSVTRYQYTDNSSTALTWPTFSLMIFWDYRGSPAYGLFTNGNWANPFASGGSNCAGGTTPQRCVKVQWLNAQSAYDWNRGRVLIPSWHGSLLGGKRDASGLEYKRNRMYDPLTGRFTQEDPIGLAGGMNQYGYAGGDPVNFSDPFGLFDVVYADKASEAAARDLRRRSKTFDRALTKLENDHSVLVTIGEGSTLGCSGGGGGAARWLPVSMRKGSRESQ